MGASSRLEQIVALIDERGFVSVPELSRLHRVSEMTIRRDLQRLDEQHRLRRTYGGAMALHPASRPGVPDVRPDPMLPEGLLVDRVDVLIASSVDPKYDRLLLERVERRGIPIIAESTRLGRETTVVWVDNYRAGLALGRWAGEYVREGQGGRAVALDLSYRLANTQARSHGFVTGLRDILPEAQVVLSLDAQSRFDTAYKLTTDALTVYPDINLIFAINDSIALGAIHACRDLKREPGSVLVLTFGLEGDTLKDELVAGTYCQGCLAMFPEIVGPVCVEAAIDAHNGESLPPEILVPYAILTPQTLPGLYEHTDQGWRIRWDAVRSALDIPYDIGGPRACSTRAVPARIGFIVPFHEHEWYRGLMAAIQNHARTLGIEVEMVDADRSMEGELDLRRRQIAQVAADQIQPGDVVLLDSGPIVTYLAEALAGKEDVTVITNSVPVFDVLRKQPGLILLSTGGLLRHGADALTGPTVEAALRELRADKLFLTVSGMTIDFGLSHTDLTEVAAKQAMIRAAREVILLADHTRFGQEAVAQVAPTSAVHRIITDEAMPASTRLELMRLGIEVIVART